MLELLRRDYREIYPEVRLLWERISEVSTDWERERIQRMLSHYIGCLLGREKPFGIHGQSVAHKQIAGQSLEKSRSEIFEYRTADSVPKRYPAIWERYRKKRDSEQKGNAPLMAERKLFLFMNLFQSATREERVEFRKFLGLWETITSQNVTYTAEDLRLFMEQNPQQLIELLEQTEPGFLKISDEAAVLETDSNREAGAAEDGEADFRLMELPLQLPEHVLISYMRQFRERLFQLCEQAEPTEGQILDIRRELIHRVFQDSPKELTDDQVRELHEIFRRSYMAQEMRKESLFQIDERLQKIADSEEQEIASGREALLSLLEEADPEEKKLLNDLILENHLTYVNQMRRETESIGIGMDGGTAGETAEEVESNSREVSDLLPEDMLTAYVLRFQDRLLELYETGVPTETQILDTQQDLIYRVFEESTEAERTEFLSYLQAQTAKAKTAGTVKPEAETFKTGKFEMESLRKLTDRQINQIHEVFLEGYAELERKKLQEEKEQPRKAEVEKEELNRLPEDMLTAYVLRFQDRLLELYETGVPTETQILDTQQDLIYRVFEESTEAERTEFLSYLQAQTAKAKTAGTVKPEAETFKTGKFEMESLRKLTDRQINQIHEVFLEGYAELERKKLQEEKEQPRKAEVEKEEEDARKAENLSELLGEASIEKWISGMKEAEIDFLVRRIGEEVKIVAAVDSEELTMADSGFAERRSVENNLIYRNSVISADDQGQLEHFVSADSKEAEIAELLEEIASHTPGIQQSVPGSQQAVGRQGAQDERHVQILWNFRDVFYSRFETADRPVPVWFGRTGTEAGRIYLREREALRERLWHYVKTQSETRQEELLREWEKRFYYQEVNEKIADGGEVKEQISEPTDGGEVKEQISEPTDGKEAILHDIIHRADSGKLREMLTDLLEHATLEEREMLAGTAKAERMEITGLLVTEGIPIIRTAYEEILDRPYGLVFQKRQLMDVVRHGNRQELQQLFSYMSANRMLENRQRTAQRTEEVRSILYRRIYRLTDEQTREVLENVAEHILSVQKLQRTELQETELWRVSMRTAVRRQDMETEPEVTIVYKQNTTQDQVRREIEEVVGQHVVTEQEETRQLKQYHEMTLQSTEEQSRRLEELQKQVKEQSVQMEELKSSQSSSTLNHNQLYQEMMGRMERQLRLERLRRGLD
ncbi:MAG: hypothetical protein LUE96_02885 [Lachnospiraceae bacterium]|nr:hypothetical protein [Lachnospiraceae bacterium]